MRRSRDDVGTYSGRTNYNGTSLDTWRENERALLGHPRIELQTMRVSQANAHATLALYWQKEAHR